MKSAQRIRGCLLQFVCWRREAGAGGLLPCRPLLERREVEGNFLETDNRLSAKDQQSCRVCTFLKEFLYRENVGHSRGIARCTRQSQNGKPSPDTQMDIMKTLIIAGFQRTAAFTS